MRSNGILVDIANPFDKIGRIHNPTIVIASLPDIDLAFQAKRKAALDVLHRLLERYLRSGREDEVNMIRHDDKRVKGEAFFGALVLQCVNQ